MNKDVLDYVTEKTHALMQASSCYPGLKKAAQAWLDSVGKSDQTAQTENYIKELESDVMPIGDLIDFAKSSAGIKEFGADMAVKVAKHAEEIKNKGAVYCDCPACAAALAILGKKASLK